MNLRQVSVLEKMKIENALFCIISISDLGRLGRILHFSKNKTRWTFCIFFSKIVNQKGLFEKIKKKIRFFGAVSEFSIFTDGRS